MTKNYLIILVVFGAVFMAETSDEYRTITPQMLKEQMPQQTQLFQPNNEDAPPPSSYNEYNQYSDSAPSESRSNSHQNVNYNHSPQSANYGYWVHHGGIRDGSRVGARDSYSMASMPMPMHHEYDPEQIDPPRPHRALYTQPDPYDYDEMPPYPHRPRSRYYYDPEHYHPPPMNRHAYREDRPYYHRHPYDDMPRPVPMMTMIPNHIRHRRMPKPNAFKNLRTYRRVRRKPAIRGYVYGFRASENDF